MSPEQVAGSQYRPPAHRPVEGHTAAYMGIREGHGMMVPGDGTPEGVWQDEQCEGCPMPNAGIYREEFHAFICEEHYAECVRAEWRDADEYTGPHYMEYDEESW